MFSESIGLERYAGMEEGSAGGKTQDSKYSAFEHWTLLKEKYFSPGLPHVFNFNARKEM